MKPRRLTGHLTLRSGDRLPVAALKRGRKNGLTQYLVTLVDGSPLEIGAEDVKRITVDHFPGRSEITLYVRRPR